MDPSLRTHHLLKHCLSQSQRSTALAQFNTLDSKEAAKEIARMGQRELQAKFKEVYGSATKSNNNSWLRRKLYEAVGVAPLKANPKGKGRKAAGASGSRKSAGHKEGGGGKARLPKLAVKVKRSADTPCASPLRQAMAAAAGPVSILDLHQHSGLVSNDTSDSETGGDDGGSFPQSAPRSPTLPSDLPFSATPIFSLQQQAALGTLPQRPPSLPLAPPGFVPVAEPQSPLAGLHWADGFPPVPAPQPAAVSTGAAGGGFLGVGVGGSAALPPLDAPFASPFKLEDQDGAALWDAEEAQAGQPWYFGTGGDLSTLSLPTAVSLMDCSSGAGDDDEVPLLTLDLGAIDVSI